MNIRNSIGICLLAVALSACDSIGLIGQLDPSVTITKTDPIAIVEPDNASILDRQFVAAIKQTFEQSGYDVVSPNQATWILVGTVATATRYSGSETKGVGVGTPLVGGAIAVGKSKSTAEYSNDVSLRLQAYPAKEFSSQKREAVWQGIVNTTADNYEQVNQGVNSDKQETLRALVSIYGQNFYDDSIDLKNFKKKT